MGLLDQPLIDVAQALVNLFTDVPVTLRRRTQVYALTTGIESSTYEKDHELKASPPFEYKLSEIDGESIQRGDFRLIVASADITIEPTPETDVVIRNDIQYQLISVKPYASGDKIAAYELQCRK